MHYVETQAYNSSSFLSDATAISDCNTAQCLCCSSRSSGQSSSIFSLIKSVNCEHEKEKQNLSNSNLAVTKYWNFTFTIWITNVRCLSKRTSLVWLAYCLYSSNSWSCFSSIDSCSCKLAYLKYWSHNYIRYSYQIVYWSSMVENNYHVIARCSVYCHWQNKHRLNKLLLLQNPNTVSWKHGYANLTKIHTQTLRLW